MRNPFKTPASSASHVQSLAQQVRDKAKVILSIRGKDDVCIPIGSEWSDRDYQSGIHIKEIGSFRDNEESVTIAIDAPAGAVIEPHFHDNTEIIMCTKGRVKCPVNNRVLEKGKTWEIKPGVVHAFEFVEDTLLIVMWHPKFR
jgi:quercetin dioxygenase-like cupin family protein